jgi:TolB-like protein
MTLHWRIPLKNRLKKGLGKSNSSLLPLCLSQTGQYEVTSRLSTDIFCDQNVTATEVGQTLNVQYVLSGNIRRMADRVRLTLELSPSRRGKITWSARYDLKANATFEEMDQVVVDVTSAILHKGTYRPNTPRQDLSASDEVGLAVAGIVKVSIPELTESIGHALRAIEFDPKMGPAYSLVSFLKIERCYLPTIDF